MSASLVGSEMCIRDSHRSGVSPRGSRTSGGRLRTGRARSAVAASARPVSYTHLTLPTICSV
eukprot:1629496-Alexandrium_andersonii.AAC.1